MSVLFLLLSSMTSIVDEMKTEHSHIQLCNFDGELSDLAKELTFTGPSSPYTWELGTYR